MHKKAELRERPIDAEERLRESMRSHFGKERCYMIIRDGVEGVGEIRARTRAHSEEQLINDSFVLNWCSPPGRSALPAAVD